MNRTEVPDRIQRYVRYTPLVVVPCLLIASTYPGEYRVPLTYWILSMLSALAFAVGRRWPVFASLVISALAVSDVRRRRLGCCPSLFRISGRSPSSTSRCGPSVEKWLPYRQQDGAVSVLAGIWFESHEAFWSVTTAVKVLAYVGLPLLLGLYLRSQRELAANNLAQTRAAERSALARELHDLVAHHMASIVLRIGVGSTCLGAPGRGRA